MRYLNVILIDCQLSPEWNTKNTRVDLSTANEMALRYELLLGNIIFTVNDNDFSARWGWVPLVDFAASLKSIASHLQHQGSEEDFEFTESEARLHFKRQKEDVVISANYIPARATVDFQDFQAAARSFLQKLREELGKEYPQLCKNEVFQELLSES